MTGTLPVLVLGFDRPSELKLVLDTIQRQYAPMQLFIALDGPPADQRSKDRCAAVREIAHGAAWAKDVRYLERTENCGCRAAVTGALDWFFTEVSEGIILEDDCVPSADFFHFCEAMLQSYRNDPRVWQVSGTNLLGSFDTPNSYLFGDGGVWGWATWADRWQSAGPSMAGWSRESRSAARSFYGRRQWARVAPELRRCYGGTLDSWAYPWSFARAVNGGLSAIPAGNLVTNVGFGPGATHTVSKDGPFAMLPHNRMSWPLRHPSAPAFDRSYQRALLNASRPSTRARLVRALDREALGRRIARRALRREQGSQGGRLT